MTIQLRHNSLKSRIATWAMLAVFAVVPVMMAACSDEDDKKAAIETTDVDMVSYSADYALKTTHVRSGAGIAGLRGDMTYVQEDTCDAWSVRQNFDMVYHFPEENSSRRETTYTTWEGKDGKAFHFHTMTKQDGQVSDMIRGTVARVDNGDTPVVYQETIGDEKPNHALPQDYMLPTAHTRALVQHAKQHDAIVHAVVFDGADDTGPIEVNAIIGTETTTAAVLEQEGFDPKQDKDINISILGNRAWPVRIAVFAMQSDSKNQQQGSTPEYEMDMILHETGIVSYAHIDYDAFKVEQKLTKLAGLDARQCD